MRDWIAGHRVACWLLCAAVVLVPSAALAQVQYRMLTLAESAYLYSGLAAQAVLRLSSLRQLPQVIVASGVVWLVYKRMISTRPQPIAGIISYVVSCTMILMLFWPEAAPRFFAPLTIRLTPDQVTSFVAEQNGMTASDSADESGLVPPALVTAGGAAVPRFLDLLLRVATTVPLTLGQVMDPNTATSPGLTRPFERIPALTELMTHDVPSRLTNVMPDFVDHCYKPAARALVSPGGVLQYENAYPWSTQMSTALAGIPLNINKGLIAKIKDWLGLSTDTSNCQAMYQRMETNVSNYLLGRATRQGSNKQAVFNTALGMTPQAQARFHVQRELEAHLAPAVNDPNRVVNFKRALDVGGFLGGAVGNFDITAPGKSVTGQLEKLSERLGRVLGVGSFLVHWAPHLVGIAIFTVLALFPIVLLWSMFPGQHFKPLVNYFLLLVFVCSTPLWWAMVNVVANLARANHTSAAQWFMAVPNFGMGEIVYIVATVLGIILVPIIQATLLFGSWRAIGGIWHA